MTTKDKGVTPLFKIFSKARAIMLMVPNFGMRSAVFEGRIVL